MLSVCRMLSKAAVSPAEVPAFQQGSRTPGMESGPPWEEEAEMRAEAQSLLFPITFPLPPLQSRELDPSFRAPVLMFWLFLRQSGAYLPFGSLGINPGDASPFVFPLRLFRMFSLDPSSGNFTRLSCRCQRPAPFPGSPLNVLSLNHSWHLWLVLPFLVFVAVR